MDVAACCSMLHASLSAVVGMGYEAAIEILYCNYFFSVRVTVPCDTTPVATLVEYF